MQPNNHYSWVPELYVEKEEPYNTIHINVALYQ